MKLCGILLLIVWITACAAPEKQRHQNSQTTPDTQLKALTEQIVSSLAHEQKSKIAVIEFSDLEGNVSQFGRYLAEELMTQLYHTGRFEVIERRLLNEVLEEHSLSMTGIIDARSAQKVGNLLGVDAIASGSVSDLGPYAKVNARLISTATGQVFAVASVKIMKDAVVRTLMGRPMADEPESDTKAGSSKQQRPHPPEHVVEKEGFKLVLKKCTLSDRRVTCHLVITNQTENDKDFQVSYGWQYKTKIFDDWGNEYIISAAKIANKTKQYKGLSQYEAVHKKIVAGTSVPLELYFEKVSSKATRIVLLQMLCGVRGFKAEFRNIDLIE